MNTQEFPSANEAKVFKTKPLMSISEAQALERKHAQESDYYAVLLMDVGQGCTVRVRTPVWSLDEDRVPVIGEDGKRLLRNPHDVALNVWAALGADDHNLLLVLRGSCVVATPETIDNEIAMAQTSRDVV